MDKTLRTLSSSLPHLPPSQVTSHDAAMERTKANIEKKRSKLAARTERKLKHQLSTQDKATPCTHTPQDFHAPGPPGEGGYKTHPPGPDLHQQLSSLPTDADSPHQPIQELHITKVYKNISINMLKDVGMTVPKGRETRAVYMQQHRD